MPLPLKVAPSKKREIRELLARLQVAREQKDDLAEALAEAEMNRLLDELEASDAGPVEQ